MRRGESVERNCRRLVILGSCTTTFFLLRRLVAAPAPWGFLPPLGVLRRMVDVEKHRVVEAEGVWMGRERVKRREARPRRLKLNAIFENLKYRLSLKEELLGQLVGRCRD